MYRTVWVDLESDTWYVFILRVVLTFTIVVMRAHAQKNKHFAG